MRENQKRNEDSSHILRFSRGLFAIMQQYQYKKVVDPKENIRYGSISREEILYFTYDPAKEYPLRVETIGITHPDKKYFIERKHADYFIVEYVCRGEGYIHQNDRTYSVSDDCVYILQPGTKHKYGADEKRPYEKIWINFFSGIFADIFAAYGLSDQVVFPNSGCRPLFEELLAVAQESSDNDVVFLKISDILFRLVTTLAKRSKENARASHVAILVKDALDMAIYRKVTVEELTKELNVSKSQMTREFKKYFGATPYHYLLEKKVSVAKRLLSSTPMRVHEIAERLGFADEYYFSNIFKQKTGSSPRAYRLRKQSTPPLP